MNETAPPKVGEITIIIPVLNEADTIRRTVTAIRSLEGDRPEIVVVDGEMIMGTLQAIADMNDVVKIGGPKGRASQMNEGARMAKGRILLFLHSDTRLPKDGLSSIVKALSDDRIAGGSFGIAFEPNNIYLRTISFLNSIRVRITRIPYGDHAIFIRRDVFEKMGGYPKTRFMEDVMLMKKLRSSRKRIVIIPKKVITSSRRFKDDGYVRHSIRYFIVHILVGFGKDPDRLAKYYEDRRR
jgi:rSAM/selenodomain-associated transferase 2